MTHWPRITVVTPSYNQAQYLDDTIRSVLDQGYPNLEYIVIDGGSTDGSPDVIRRYADRLAYWVSEKDRGQTHAINKGMARATGDILAYLNSDDTYLPDTLRLVAEEFARRPDADLLHGKCLWMDQGGVVYGEHHGRIRSLAEALDPWRVWWAGRQFIQPEVFWRRRVADRVGPFDERLDLVMDYDYWVRIFAAGGQVARIDEPLARFRVTPTQKSSQKQRVTDEILAVVGRHLRASGDRLPPGRRLALAGDWAYQCQLLPEIEQSVARREGRWGRACRLAARVARSPSLLFSRSLHRRVRQNALRLRRAS